MDGGNSNSATIKSGFVVREASNATLPIPSQKELERFAKHFPGREGQIEQLFRLISPCFRGAFTKPVHVYGHSNTGKSLVVKSLLDFIERPCAYIDCIEHQLPKQIYASIWKQFSKRAIGDSTKCRNARDLITILNSHPSITKHGCVIALDRAEQLRERECATMSVLQTLLQLDELSNKPVTVIFISELSWDKFLGVSATGLRNPIPIHFPNYTKQQTLNILQLERPKMETAEFYSTFASLVYDSLRIATTDLREMRHATAFLFPYYVKPIQEGTATADQTTRLIKHLEPYLKKSVSKLYMHEFALMSPATDASTSVPLQIDLPLRSRYLLLAAFLASNNPRSLDTRYFSASYSGTKAKSIKAGKTSAGAADIARLTISKKPKDFPVERLLAIFRSIIEDENDEIIKKKLGVQSSIKLTTSSLSVQLASLIKLKLILRVSPEENFTVLKLRCNTDYEFANQIAQSVSFPLLNYLHIHEDF